MIKSLFAAAALAVVASSSMAATFVWKPLGNGGVATFAGTDTNSDGSLSLDELISFSISIDGFTGSLSEVVAFGSLNLSTLTWSSVDADSDELVAWVVGNNTYAFDGTVVTTETNQVSAVPEPTNAAFLLAGLGLLGAVARRKASNRV